MTNDGDYIIEGIPLYAEYNNKEGELRTSKDFLKIMILYKSKYGKLFSDTFVD